MANLNINRNVTDQFYRYKMPRLIAKVEGKGNGIKTVIVNMVDIAKALERPPTYPTKYFGCELGAQTQFDLKNERYIVNGAHDAAKLQGILDGFIQRFVLCQECENPETRLVVQQKKQVILERCIACGHQGNIDMRHKLTTFILKNPPTQDLNTASTPGKDKNKKGKKGKDAVNGESSPENNENHNEDNIVPMARDDEDDDDWGEDTSDAAVAQRLKDLSEAAKNLAVTEDIEKTPHERINIFYDYVKGKKEAGTLSDKELMNEAERLDIKDKAPLVLAELLLDNDKNILQLIKQYRRHFLRFTHENPKAQKYLLGGFEQIVGNVYKETLMPKVPHILKLFYDLDVLDEEVLIEWDSKVSKKYVDKDTAKEIHEKAAMFINWLKEAEEDSSDDEGVEVEFSGSKTVGCHTIPKVDNQTNNVEDDEDDLNIDDI